MSEMKSAWEKALEKTEKLGKLTEDELRRLEYLPIGNKLAAKYLELEHPNNELNSELTKHKGTGARKYIVEGAQETFLRNINLPHHDRDKQVAKKAMSGLKLLKENKNQLDAVFERIENLFNYYEQARQQTFTQFKQSFEDKVRRAAPALQQQMKNTAALEAGLQQQFQEEWQRVSSQLDSQYQKALEEHKEQILKTA
ncbi:MAG: hypothetical protein FJ024_08350 [Chloroflexi bacterium]|nr:hypothetical protein [Chloroflexota bacterium]